MARNRFKILYRLNRAAIMRRPAAVKPKQFIGPLPRPVMKVAQKRIKKVKPDIGVPIGSIIARAQRMKTIPFRVQLAVASDSGSFSAQQMANIRSKEAYLYSVVRKEANDVNRAIYKGGDAKKYAQDLANVFAKIGMNYYILNYPNMKALRAVSGASKRQKTGLHTQLRQSRFAELNQKVNSQIQRKEYMLASLFTNPNYSYRDPRTGQIVQHTTEAVQRRLAALRERAQGYKAMLS